MTIPVAIFVPFVQLEPGVVSMRKFIRLTSTFHASESVIPTSTPAPTRVANLLVEAYPKLVDAVKYPIPRPASAYGETREVRYVALPPNKSEINVTPPPRL